MLKKAVMLIVVAGWIFTGAEISYGYVIDGYLNDWGVTPFTDWTPDNTTINYRVEDDTNVHPPYEDYIWARTSNFAESRDLEAMYFDSDDEYFYLALVSSIPFDPYYAAASPIPEDLALSVGAYWNYGLDIGLLGARTDDGPPMIRNVYDTYNPATNYYMEGWYYCDDGKGNWLPIMIMNGSVVGQYEIFNRYLGPIEEWTGAGAEPPDCGTAWGWTSRTYAIEARVPLSLFSDWRSDFNPNAFPADYELSKIRLLMTKYECISDYIYLEGSLDGTPPTTIPEPSTLLLFGMGAILFRSVKRGRSAIRT